MSELTNPNDSNPIIEMFCGIPIRRYNHIGIKLDPITYKELLRAEIETGLSQRQILGYSSRPCKLCEGAFVRVLNSNSMEVKIIRGLLSKRIPDGSGSGKKHKFNNDCECPDPLK